MSSREQAELLVVLDNLVSKDHPYRALEKLFDFKALCAPHQDIYAVKGRKDLGIERAFKMLLLQFMEDVSDREMERFMRENTSSKWFCGFGLCERTPDHSYFGKFRQRLGTSRLMKIFNTIRSTLKEQGYLRETFTFVDASALVSKLSTWSDRDKAIAEGLETFDNITASKVAADKQARFGCKGKNKHWYGYKEHASVDAQSGLVNKIAVTPANVTDAEGLKNICPNNSIIYGDKGYSVAPATQIIKAKGCANATIRKNNHKDKNKEQDHYRSKLRAPYERVFSKRSKYVRYKSIMKVQFQSAMNAICHNFKRLLVLGASHLQPAIG